MANQDQLLLELAGGIERHSHQAERLLHAVRTLRYEALGTERPAPRVPPVNGATPVAIVAVAPPLASVSLSRPSVYDYFTELDEKIRALRERSADTGPPTP